MFPLRILFDLDGTLLDTAPDLHKSLNYCLKYQGREEVSLESVKHMVGQGARNLLIRGLNATGGMVEEAQLDHLFEVFLEYYGKHLSDVSVPFPGVMNALETLKAKGCEMGICTNKPVNFARELSTDFGMDPYISAITGGDSFDFKKPDPRHLTLTLEQMGGKDLPVVMVGDSNNDIDAAKAAGFANIAVSFGYTDTPPRELGADIVIDHFDELVDALDALSHG
ncbi:phosphoglycolate phosphatase [Sneathiella limimaris]|uniref:phosphoglycolate phosphatase n=1 Tax=Sneathiella limimaris TaxID=1964213 RepID=UPI00146C0262|nr:phosphoglycolate phosphatase [Sneathiella limimaris]